ncbi:hypothetical protein JTE90_021954 [Oedothorax gibbosus]|uniref:Replication protein A C-terminal domain-containing protein n=1 Tax=Oedothorax gibbosus TaxID=931172 RepID=A0AAV6V3K9_9ARAC|nr:hypothetical protein JTE90_021954 [Oedothorax gibbosus]
MWPATSGDGGFGGAVGGGGFLNTSGSTPNAAEKKKPEKWTNVVPINIAQIHLLSESEENVKVGSQTAKIVTFVALVQSVDVQTTKVTYVVSDFTAPPIEVHAWIGENDDPEKCCPVRVNEYCRTTGVVRSAKGGKRHVMAFNIRPLRELGELTQHIAEVMHTSMAIRIKDKESAESACVLASAGMDCSEAAASSLKLTGPQQLVRHAIGSCKDEVGISVSELCNTLKSLTRQSIRDALIFLSNEGHIYTTIDEDHYKSIDCV